MLGPSACGKGPDGRAKRLSRDKDASAVLVVDSTQEQILTFSDEAEPNNDVSQATALALGAGAKGSLDGAADVDVYAVVVPKLGLLNARLSGIDGVDLILELRDSSGNVLVRSDRGPALTIEGLPNYPVTAQTYYLAVSEFVKKSRKRKKKNAPAARQGPSPTYELTVRQLPDATDGGEGEAEPNEANETAAELVIGDSVTGYLGWAKDVDVWKLSTEGFAAEYSIDLDISAVPGTTPTLTIADSDGKVILRRKGIKSRGLSVRNLVAAKDPLEDGSAPDESSDTPDPQEADPSEDDPDQYLYLELRARRSNPIESYRISAATRLLDLDDEVEPNDESTQPGALREDPSTTEGARRGHLTIGDVDYYQIVAGSSALLLSVTAKPAGNANIELAILIDGQIAAMADEGKAKAAESLPDTRIEAGKSALIKIAGRGSLDAEAAYELRWSVDPAGPPGPAGPAAEPGSGPSGAPGVEPENGDPGLLDDYEDE